MAAALRPYSRLRASLFGRRLLLWTLGLLACLPTLWGLATQTIPWAALALLALMTFAFGGVLVRHYHSSPLLAIEAFPTQAIGTTLPWWLGYHPTDGMTFLLLWSGGLLGGALAGALFRPYPRVDVPRLERDVGHAVLTALAHAHRAGLSFPLEAVVLDPVMTSEGGGHLGLQHIFPYPLCTLRCTPPAEDAPPEAQALWARLGDLLARPYLLPVDMPHRTSDAFPYGVLWEAPTSAHGRLALQAQVAALAAQLPAPTQVPASTASPGPDV